uniref:Uncharacterized protein n=1 Tax=Anguilla anguilla TaxID=7936 RepID=A0A0E9WKC1_ANGAN
MTRMARDAIFHHQAALASCGELPFSCSPPGQFVFTCSVS